MPRPSSPSWSKIITSAYSTASENFHCTPGLQPNPSATSTPTAPVNGNHVPITMRHLCPETTQVNRMYPYGTDMDSVARPCSESENRAERPRRPGGGRRGRGPEPLQGDRLTGGWSAGHLWATRRGTCSIHLALLSHLARAQLFEASSASQTVLIDTHGVWPLNGRRGLRRQGTLRQNGIQEPRNQNPQPPRP